MIKTFGALALLALSTLPALAQQDPLAGGAPARADSKTVVVGSADFPESQLLATIYAKALSAKGLSVETKLNIGSREVYMPALLDGSIDLLPEYNGSVLTYFDKNAAAHSTEDVTAALKSVLPKCIAMLTASKAEDADAVSVTRATANKYKLKTIEDLKPAAGELTLGAPPEWPARRQGGVGMKEIYGIEFKSFKPLDVAGPLTIAALANGQIQVADLFTTDPSIAANNFVVLEDTKHMFTAQNVAPLIAEGKISDVVTKTLNAISAALTTEDLIKMNGRLANHESYDAVAADWLTQHKID